MDSVLQRLRVFKGKQAAAVPSPAELRWSGADQGTTPGPEGTPPGGGPSPSPDAEYDKLLVSSGHVTRHLTGHDQSSACVRVCVCVCVCVVNREWVNLVFASDSMNSLTVPTATYCFTFVSPFMCSV